MAATPPTTLAPTTPIIDQPTLLAAPTFDPLLALPLPAVLLAPAEAAVPVEPPSVSEEMPWPAHSALYVLRTLCPTDTSELSVLTIQLIQDWMPLRFEDVQTQDKSVQAEIVLRLVVHPLWHAGGKSLIPVGD